MITLTRLDETPFGINHLQIERVDVGPPHTVVVMMNGNRYLVRETLDEVVDTVGVAGRRGPAGWRGEEGGVEVASLIGLVLTLIGIFVGLVLKGADPVALFTNVPALLIVIVGTIGVVWTSHSMEENLAALKSLKVVYMPPPRPDTAGLITRMAEYARHVRSEGYVALESRLADEPDPFVRNALLMTVDGSDPQVVERSLRREVKASSERHKRNASWFQTAGVFAPTLGIIGAVIGLIAVLGNLEDMEKLGHGIAAAFIATFWGVFLANGLFLPWSKKLLAFDAEEVRYRHLVIEATLAMQGGASPRTIVETLEAVLPPSERRGADTTSADVPVAG